MTKLNSINKKITKKDLKVLFIDLSKLLVEFFNCVVIQIDEKCTYES